MRYEGQRKGGTVDSLQTPRFRTYVIYYLQQGSENTILSVTIKRSMQSLSRTVENVQSFMLGIVYCVNLLGGQNAGELRNLKLGSPQLAFCTDYKGKEPSYTLLCLLFINSIDYRARGEVAIICHHCSPKLASDPPPQRGSVQPKNQHQGQGCGYCIGVETVIKVFSFVVLVPTLKTENNRQANAEQCNEQPGSPDLVEGLRLGREENRPKPTENCRCCKG